MNLPGETSNDRRAVPRHIRDGEHDMPEEAVDGPAPAGHIRTVLLAVSLLVAAAIAWWLLRR